MRVQAHECMLRKLQMESTSRNSTDYEVLLVETHCLMNEYAKIHVSIQTNAIALPPCWEALVPLKTEYYKSLSHLYFAKRFSKSSTSEIGDEKNRLKTIKAHLQASQAAHEEILRLQRMCRELKVSIHVSLDWERSLVIMNNLSKYRRFSRRLPLTVNH